MGSVSPWVRAPIEAGAALLGLRVVAYGPEECAAFGEPSLVGGRLGRLHLALIGCDLAPGVLAALGAHSPVPVVNGGGHEGDPVGAVADLAWLLGRWGGQRERRVVWLGDACGLAQDLLVGGARLGLSVGIVHPPGFAPEPERVVWARDAAALTGGAVLVTTDLAEGLANASAVYVDAWPVGMEDRFRGYALHRHSMKGVRADAVVLHRAIERRGAEISGPLAEEAAHHAAEQIRLRADAWAALLARLLEPDPLTSVLSWSR